MKSLFISHDNRDKGAIGPFLRALHADGFTLFIDRPAEVGLDPNDDRIRSIRIDENFGIRIPNELEEADLVLVFWTMNSAKNAQRNDVLGKEITLADHRRTLRCVLIADDEKHARSIEAELPQLFNPLQHIKFLGTDASRLAEHPSFRSLCTQLRETVILPGEEPYKDLGLDVIAMLVDRGSPIETFKAAGTTSLKFTATPPGARRTHGIVVVGHIDDYPRLLDERFKRFDGRECFQLVEELRPRLPVVPEWITNRQWNYYDMYSPETEGMRPDDFSDYMQRKLQLLNCSKPLRGKGSKYAIVSTVSVREVDIRQDPAGNIAAWLAAWDRELAAPPDVPVMPVLYITHQDEPPGWLASWFWYARPGTAERLAKSVDQALQKARPEHFDVTVASDLRKIEWVDARAWLRAYVPRRLYSDVDTLLRRLFPQKERTPGYAMDDFYSELIKSPPFNGTAA